MKDFMIVWFNHQNIIIKYLDFKIKFPKNLKYLLRFLLKLKK